MLILSNMKVVVLTEILFVHEFLVESLVSMQVNVLLTFHFNAELLDVPRHPFYWSWVALIFKLKGKSFSQVGFNFTQFYGKLVHD